MTSVEDPVPVEKYGQQWWVSFAMFDDVDRDVLMSMFSARIVSIIEAKGYVPVDQPHVRFLDSRVDSINPAWRVEGDETEVLAIATVHVRVKEPA